MKIESERDPYKMETTFAIKLGDEEMQDLPEWMFIDRFGVDSEEYRNFSILMDILSLKREEAYNKYLEEKDERIEKDFKMNMAINNAKKGMEQTRFGGPKLLEAYKELWK